MRVLISIGCDAYIRPPLTPLKGAENDARRIFDHLVTAGWGDYDRTRSRLLLSPTLHEVREAVDHVLFDTNDLVEFTFFFAGHGGVKDGAYFLCVRDTMLDRLSMSSLSMTQLLAWVSEAKVANTNIVIDACHSGGVVHDIATLLNPTVIGKAGSISVSILAASGSDEYALEANGAGMCTNTLMSCLTGDVVVQTTRPTFDLVEIGKVVSTMMAGTGQTPLYWGINLYGQAQLAKNPAFGAGAPKISATIENLTRSALADDSINAHADEIWKQYLSIGREFEPASLLSALEPICARLTEQDIALASFIRGIASTFGPRVNEAQGGFGEAQLYAICITAVLKSVKDGNAIDRLVRELALDVVLAIDRSAREILDLLQANKYALVARDEMFAGFYFLPLRIMSMLGWIGAAAHIARYMGFADALSTQTLRELTNLIVSEYSQSIVAVSDEQTPSFISFATAGQIIGYTSEVETVTGYIFGSLHQHHGCVAQSGISGTDAFRFLFARIEGKASELHSVVARPQSLLAAMLLTYDALGLSEVPDQDIRRFDRLQINLFVPDSYLDFGLEFIEEGVNNSFEIGHSIFTVSDLRSAFVAICKRFEAERALELPSVRTGALLASLVRPDREAWFLFDSKEAGSSALDIGDA